MLRSRKLRIVLTLMILLGIWPIGSTAQDEGPPGPVSELRATVRTTLPDSMQIVPKRLLRDATRRIDQQDLRIMLLENRIAERDSIAASQQTEWQARLAHWQEYAEKVKASTWDLIWPALLVLLGVAAGRL